VIDRMGWRLDIARTRRSWQFNRHLLNIRQDHKVEAARQGPPSYWRVRRIPQAFKASSADVAIDRTAALPTITRAYRQDSKTLMSLGKTLC
jgi:hypothetical protein